MFAVKFQTEQVYNQSQQWDHFDQPALEVEGKNGTPSLEEVSGFNFFKSRKIDSAKQRSGIHSLIILIHEGGSNLTRVIPIKVTCIKRISRL